MLPRAFSRKFPKALDLRLCLFNRIPLKSIPSVSASESFTHTRDFRPTVFALRLRLHRENTARSSTPQFHPVLIAQGLPHSLPFRTNTTISRLPVVMEVGFIQNGRRRITERIGTVCLLECPIDPLHQFFIALDLSVFSSRRMFHGFHILADALCP